MMTTRVIVLNGASSVGKSSTARALQKIAAGPFLHVRMDDFLDMLPEAMFGRAEGLVFETISGGGAPCVAVRSGAVVERAMRGMRHAIAALAGQGNDLIVDDVMLGGDEQRDYRRLLAAHAAFFVGLFAPLEVLEARERARGDRTIGLARWQHDRVHAGLTYDLEIDTSVASPLECARNIKMVVGV